MVVVSMSGHDLVKRILGMRKDIQVLMVRLY
jgi:hypothetical protein